MVEYRPLPADQRRTFYEYVSYAFSPENGPPEYDPDEHETERANLGERRGLYGDDADPLCVCRHYWFDARVRGEIHPTPGLAAVASPPENRRSGFVRRLLEASLEEYRERGGRFSVLWPFRYRFYRQYGWDTCNRRTVYECGPSALSFATERIDDDGEYRALEADDYDTVAPVYGAHASEYVLSLVRDEDWWRYRVFRGWKRDPFVYAWERDGDVRSYLIYEIDGDWGERTMTVADFAFVDHEAFLALLAFCHSHDSQVETVRIHAPEGTRLLDLVPDPEAVDCERETGPMVRIVDVAETLSALSYPDVDEHVTVQVDDPLVDWNDGRFSLEVAGGDATCERTDASADARVDVGALSQLAVGYRSARDLARIGRLESDSETAVGTLETLFPEMAVYLRDRF